jgi:hypothetical protein
MNIIKDFVFQHEAEADGNGAVYQVGHDNQIALFVTRTGGAGTVNFEGSDVDGTWYSIYATKQIDASKAVNTAGTAECWIVDTTPWTSVRAPISGYAAPAVITVKGHAVNTVG